MKMLSPSERVRPVGNTQWWTALIAVASVSCLPLFSVLADQNNQVKKGGGTKAPSSHQSAPHGGGGNKIANVHQGGNHTMGTSHSAGNRTVSTPKTVTAHQTANHSEVQRTAVSHHGSASHNVANRTTTSPQTVARKSVTTRAEHTRLSNSQERNLSPGLRHGASPNTRASLYQNNTNTSREARNHQVVAKQQGKVTVVNRSSARETTAYNHSLTATSVHNMMSQRITQITNRQWTSHGMVFSTHSDRQHGYWYQHAGYWWRGNFWGARSYCVGLIGLGRPPGLCWAWYDNICWGNVVIGMPLDLISYYYPDPVYTSDTDYDGQDGTVYYYATDDGQYKELTVVDGEVVDVEIVDQLPS